MTKFITEFKNKEGASYGWHIFAETWEEAQKEADKRGINETVVGYIPNDCLDCEQELELRETI